MDVNGIGVDGIFDDGNRDGHSTGHTHAVLANPELVVLGFGVGVSLPPTEWVALEFFITNGLSPSFNICCCVAVLERVTLNLTAYNIISPTEQVIHEFFVAVRLSPNFGVFRCVVVHDHWLLQQRQRAGHGIGG